MKNVQRIRRVLFFTALASVLTFSVGNSAWSRSKPVLWIYTSIYKEVVSELEKPLQEAVPEVEIRWFQGGSETIASKLNAELLMGRPQADLILTSDPFWYQELKEAGKLENVQSAAAAYVPKDYADPEGAFATVRLCTMVIGYNSKLISAADAPKSWKDLQDPKWKGKIAMGSPLESGTTFSAVALLSKKLGWDFFRNLREQDVLCSGGNSTVLNRIETGERPVGILLLENILKAEGKGSPIRPIYPRDGVIPASSPIAIIKGTHQLPAAKKVYDWFFGVKAQTAIVKSGMYSFHPEVPAHKRAIPLAEAFPSGGDLMPWSPAVLQELFRTREEIKSKFSEIVLVGKGSEGSSSPRSIIIEATVRSLELALLVAAFSGFLGVVFAWLVARSNLPGGVLLSRLLTVPYALPAYLLGMAWVVLGNPNVGLLRDLLPGTGTYGFWGMVFVETGVAFAFPFLELKAGFEKLDPSLEEAARMSGAAPFKVFCDVSLPLLWPALLNGMVLSFLYTISSFGVPAILGLPVRKFVLTTLIYSQIKVGGAAGLIAGLKLSLILLVIAIAALFLSGWLNRVQRKRSQAIASGKASRPSIVELGPWRGAAGVAVWAFWIVVVALPWLALGLSALAPLAGDFSPAHWTARNLSYVVHLADFREGLRNSLILTLIVATGLVLGGFVLGFLAVRRGQRWAGALVQLAALPFATPGSVLALLIVFASAWFGGVSSPLFWMAVAYALKYAAVPARMMTAAFRQVHPSLEEAARICGASPLELLGGIWFPMLKGALSAGWFLAALPIFTELTMSVLLTGPGGATLGTVLFQLQEYADQPSAAALAWILLTIALAVAVFRAFRAGNEVKE